LQKPTRSTTQKQIILHAGEFYFGAAGVEVHTLLGSCVSISLWHPRLLIGGLCHFALPYKPDTLGVSLNCRYADDCMEMFKRAAHSHGTKLREYQAKIFGGGNVQPNCSARLPSGFMSASIGERNSAAALQLLMQEELEIQVIHVGEFGYRKIIFDIGSGYVWVKFTSILEQQHIGELTGKA